MRRGRISAVASRNPHDSGVNVTFSEDLKLDFRALRQLRNREAEIEASIMGGELYLAAYAQRLGSHILRPKT